MHKWWNARVRSGDDYFRSEDRANSALRAAPLAFVGVVLAAMTMSGAGPGYAFPVVLLAAAAALSIRSAVISLRFSDPMQIDSFLWTRKVPLGEVDHFACRQLDALRNGSYWEIYAVRRDGAELVIPALREGRGFGQGKVGDDSNKAAEATVRMLDAKLAEWREAQTGTLKA